MARMRRIATPQEGGDLALNMTFRVSAKVRDQLLEAAKRNGDQSIGQEIRQRLEASFAGELPAVAADDPKTREAAAAIVWLLGNYERVFGHGEAGHWYDDAQSFLTVRAAAREILNVLAPEGADLDAPDDDLGARLLARIALLQARGEL